MKLKSQTSNFKLFTDQLGREIQIPFPPKRIISIVPSQTELLFDLGLEKEIIGVTKFCIHPEEKVKSITKVGGTKNLDIEKIKSLQPDLIIGNKEENEEQQIKELMEDFPVWMTDIKTIDDAYEMIGRVGEMLDRNEWSTLLIEEIKSAFAQYAKRKTHSALQAAYLIWNNPMMTVGNDTFIHHMLGVTGFENVFADQNRYPEITIENLQKKAPEFVLLSSEPFPFKQKHVDELQQQLPSTKIILVDGEMFSWYGSRLLKAPKYFSELLSAIP